MKCIACDRTATDMHHLIITRSMARGVPKSNKKFWNVVESPQNKYPLCHNCHLNSGGSMGHLSRADGLDLLRSSIGRQRADEIFETVLRDAEQYTKTKFARVVG